MKVYKLLAATGIIICIITSCQVPAMLPSWHDGYMDIHHIATGQGDCVFAVLPDATTFLIDAGDNGLPNGSRHWFRRVPDTTRTTGGWLCRYIRHFSPGPSSIDYALLTHFHSDHLGSVKGAVPGTHGYNLSGLTYVGDSIRIHTLVDRDWPDYNFPTHEKILRESPFFGEYQKFIAYQREHGMDMERFEVGSKEQFLLKNNPRRYRDIFEIRNLVGNARVWTGQGNSTRVMYQGDSTLFDENMPSCGVRIRYGKFTYYNCGDLSGLNFPRYKCQERDFESEVAKVVGKISVMKCDHHAATDVVNENLLRAARPDAMIVIAGHREHPYPSTMERMIDKGIYPDERDLYITTECSKDDLGEELWAYFKPAGHIVVRVYPGGNKYQVFVLDVFSDDYKIKYVSPVKRL
ncbi:MAG: MBL fold metallo-hydrolase [Bacteroidales bacterium]|nr:MBL fold metallo-hydrolase [Bacteroidales bacterium]